MRPLKLTLTGFIGIKAGLGLDTFTLDLERLAGDASLVALIGPNGAGKSTIMDSLTPYRLMASRASGYSPGSFSFYDHTTGEAKKGLDWEHNGLRYRSTLLIKQTAKTKKTEAYLFAQAGEGWVPATIPDGTVSDGKADTYDRIVDHICGSPEMFFTSAFSSQGRRSLSSYANGEIKGLLSELLGLDHIRELGKKAGDEAKARKMNLDAQRDKIVEIAQREADLIRESAELESAKVEVVAAESARACARKATTAAAKMLADIQATAAGNTEIEVRRAGLTKRINIAMGRISEEQDRAKADIYGAERSHAAAESSINADIRTTQAQIAAANNQINGAKVMQARAQEVVAARGAAPMLAMAVTGTATALDAARSRDQEAHNLTTRINGGTSTLAGIIREGKHLAEQLGSLKTRSELIDAVPCKGIELPGACPLLADAEAAKKALPAASTATTEKRADFAKMNQEQEDLKAKLHDLGDTAAALRSAVALSEDAAKAVRANDAILALAPAIEQADQVIATAQQNLVSWRSTIDTKTAELGRLNVDHAARLAEIAKRLDEAKTAINADLAAARAEIETLPPPADTTALTAAESALQTAERALSDADQAVSRINARIGALTERIAKLASDLAGADEFKAAATAMEDDIAQWTLLARALGNDGIIALSIDDAGPTLAAYANDLLLSCYGPRFSVSIQTQAETAKGDMKETFDIRVFDGDTGDDKSVRDMSGGQKIYINEALTRAIALYQAEMHGRHYECLFADESDGALDPERKVQFMQMKRKVLELGGYKSELFISHTPELWGMADVVINLEDFRS